MFDDENQRPYPGKKDKNRWCKGKIGKEHSLQVAKYSDIKQRYANLKVGKHVFGANWYLQYCKSCGKEINIYYSFQKKNKPQWLVDYLKRTK